MKSGNIQLKSQIPNVVIRHPEAMTPAHIAEWNVLRAGHADYRTPLLSPQFAIAAAQGRSDARVAMISDDDGLLSVLAFYVRAGAAGRPLGAPFCDYSGPIVRADCSLSLQQIVRLSGLSSWRSHSLLDPYGVFGGDLDDFQSTMIIQLDGQTPAEFLEARRAQHPKRFKNFRRLENQMLREGHDLTFRFGALDETLRKRLFALKSAQFKVSGMVDLIDATRSRAILDAVMAAPGGFQTSLWSGDILVSAHFGFRDGAAFHPWIAAYDPVFAHFSPGNLLLRRIVEAMPEMGLTEYDLAEGHDHYKKYYTSAARRVRPANVTIGLRHKGGDALWRFLGADRDGSAVQRLRRRMDHAANSESRWIARAVDLGVAMRRSHAIPHSGANASE